MTPARRARALVEAALAATGALAVVTIATQPPTSSTTTDPTPGEQARQAVTTQQWQHMTDWTSCWEHPSDAWGRTPTHAIVKEDGTTIVTTRTAPDAHRLSQAGTHWILAWCDAPQENPT